MSESLVSLAPRFFVQGTEKETIDATGRIASLQATNEALVRDFGEKVSQLEVSVADGRHNKESLLELYIQSIRPENISHLLIRSASLEHGTEAFFAKIMPSSPCPSQASGILERYEDQLVRGLVESIARMASLGLIDLDCAVSCKFGI